MGIGSDQADQKEEKAEPIGSDQAGQKGDGCVHWIGSGGAEGRRVCLLDQIRQGRRETCVSIGSDQAEQ